MTRWRPPTWLIVVLAAFFPLGWATCDYGSVNPSAVESPDPGDEGGAGEGGGVGSGGPGSDGGPGTGDDDEGDDDDEDDDEDEDDDDDGVGDSDAGSGGGDTGGGGSFQHLSFPIQAGTTHSAFTCGDCHSDLANPTSPAALACTTCHTGSHAQATMQARHSAAPGVGALFVWSAPACLTCHPQATLFTRAQHEQGVLNEEGHEGNTCTSCHPAQSDLAPATFAATRCTPCHTGNPEDDDDDDDDEEEDDD